MHLAGSNNLQDITLLSLWNKIFCNPIVKYLWFWRWNNPHVDYLVMSGWVEQILGYYFVNVFLEQINNPSLCTATSSPQEIKKCLSLAVEHALGSERLLGRCNNHDIQVYSNLVKNFCQKRWMFTFCLIMESLWGVHTASLHQAMRLIVWVSLFVAY